MYIESKNLIFIHIPKTGGNSLSTLLLAYSSEEKAATGHQDGVDRFSIVGNYTAKKHQPLQQYFERMGSEMFSQNKIVTSLRHPVDRCISAYFSPSARMAKKKSLLPGLLSKLIRKDKNYYYQDVDFDLEEFKNLVTNGFPSQSEYLRLNGKVIKPDYINDFANYETSVKKFAESVDISTKDVPFVNRSGKDQNTKAMLVRDKTIIDIVKNSPHGFDWENFPEMGWA